MRVHESGPADATSIVFLHGVAASARMWDTHAEYFSTYHCLMPDFPGFGGSAGERWPTVARVSAEVAEIIHGRANGRAHVVGMSLGGIVAMSLMASTPQLIDHAIVDGAGVLPVPGLPLVKLVLRLSPLVIKSDLAINLVASSIGVPKDSRGGIRRDYRRMSSRAFAAAFVQALDFREPPGLVAVDRPTLFVAGSREPTTTRASQRQLARTMPNAVAALVPRRWHSWIAGEPELHCRMVDAWINDRPLPEELAVVARDVRSSGASPE